MGNTTTEQTVQVLRRTHSVNQEVRQHCHLAPLQEFRGGGAEFRQSAVGRIRSGTTQGGRRWLNLDAGNVGWHHNVSGPPMCLYCAEHTVHFVNRISRGQISDGARYLTSHASEMRKIPIAEAVVQQSSGCLRILRRGADNMHHRHILRERASDRVNSRELPHAECGDHGSYAVHSRVPVGRVARVQLIGVADPVQRIMPRNVIQEFQVEITRNPKNILNMQFS